MRGILFLSVFALLVVGFGFGEIQAQLPYTIDLDQGEEDVRILGDGGRVRPSESVAAPTNGGFETGDLTNWTTSGGAGRVEVLQASDFSTSAGPPPTPTEGNYFALLCNGPGVINPISQGNIDLDGLVTHDYDTSILSTTFNLTASDVPITLSFDWSFLTAESRNALDSFDDFFRVRLNGGMVLSGSRPVGGVSPYLDVGGIDNVMYQVIDGPTGETLGSNFVHGRNSFQIFRMIISNPGSYSLEFLVADQGDNQRDSGLLIDNITLTPIISLDSLGVTSPGGMQNVPFPATVTPYGVYGEIYYEPVWIDLSASEPGGDTAPGGSASGGAANFHCHSHLSQRQPPHRRGAGQDLGP